MISIRKLLNEVMSLDDDSYLNENKSSEEAKRLGLTYMSFGRYGKDGKVTHKSVNGKLQPIKGGKVKAPAKKPTPSVKAPAKTTVTKSTKKPIAKEITRAVSKLFSMYDKHSAHDDRYSGAQDAVKFVNEKEPKTKDELKQVIKSVIGKFEKEAKAEGAISSDDWYQGVYDFQDHYAKQLKNGDNNGR